MTNNVCESQFFKTNIKGFNLASLFIRLLTSKIPFALLNEFLKEKKSTI